MLRRLAIVALAATALAVAVGASRAQHSHPPQDAGIHDRFYSTWMRPDMPTVSCCSKQDCYPVEARFSNGQWHAKRREDGKWLLVPASKIERNRDSPDGRNHLCAPPPNNYEDVPGGVYCFAIGGGT
jgi:hypothetical protein